MVGFGIKDDECILEYFVLKSINLHNSKYFLWFGWILNAHCGIVDNQFFDVIWRVLE